MSAGWPSYYETINLWDRHIAQSKNPRKSLDRWVNVSVKNSVTYLNGKPSRKGLALVYVIAIMTAMIAMCSLAVDYARMRLAKTQLQMAADAAALYGITGLSTSVTTAQSRAISAASDNKVDGTPLVLATSDVEFGLWDPAVRVFTPLSGSLRLSATAMRITARRTNMSLPFASMIGFRTIDIQSSAIAELGDSSSINIPAICCPWLAGMPNGSTVTDNTYHHTSTAPANSPMAVDLPVTPGQTIYFRDNSGTTGDTSTGKTYGLDGDATRTDMAQASANHINTTTAPLNALMGLFLNDKKPTSNSMPSNQPDFSSPLHAIFPRCRPAYSRSFLSATE